MTLPITGWFAELYGTAAATITPTATASGHLPTRASATITPTALATGFLTMFGDAAATVTPTLAATGQAVGAAATTVTPSTSAAGYASGIAAATITAAPSVAGQAVGTAATTVTPSPSATGHIAPTYDTSAKSTKQNSLASGSPFTWSSGAGSTAGAYGIVFIPCESGGMDLSATASVTWGGTAMTSLGSQYNANTSTSGWGWVFILNGIPSGAQTISVTLTQAGKTFTGYGFSYSYNNVSSVGSLQTAFGVAGTNPSISVTAANTTDIIWGAILSNNTSQSAFSLTTRQSTTIAPVVSSGDTTGSATVSSTASGDGWSAFGLDLQ